MAWHYEQEWSSAKKTDLWIDRLQTSYKSNLYRGTDRPVPIADGGEFWGIMQFQYKNLGTHQESVKVQFSILVDDTRQPSWNYLWLPKTSDWKWATVETYHRYLDARGSPPGQQFPTDQELFWTWINPDDLSTIEEKIASDGDASVYEIVRVKVDDIHLVRSGIRIS